MTEENTNIFANEESFRAHLNRIQNPETQEEVKENPHVEEEKLPTEEAVSSDEEKPIEEDIEAVEATEPTDNNDKEGYKENKYIPKSRFNQELERKKVLEEQLLKERDERLKLEAKLELFQQYATQQPRVEQAPTPRLQDVDALDKESHSVYEKKFFELERVAKEALGRTQALQTANLVYAQKNSFEKDYPDYMQAVEHIKKVESTVFGNFTSDPKQIDNLVMQKLESIGLAAMNGGRNAAEAIYKAAQAYGYNPSIQEAKPSEKGTNLDAIASNMKKTASIQSLGNSIGGGAAAKKPASIKDALYNPKNPKSGIDPEKFRQLLSKAS